MIGTADDCERMIAMKRFFKVLTPLMLAALCFAGCSNIPDEPATTGIENHTYINELGVSVPVAENIGDYPGITQPHKYLPSTHNVEFTVKSYYVYGNTVVTFEDIELESLDVPQANVYGSVDAKIMGKGKENKMKIAYNAYDKDGNLLRKNACMTADIDGKKDGSTFSFIFAVPLDTVKVEFFDYVK